MATLEIDEYRGAANSIGGTSGYYQQPITSQKVTTSGVSAQSAAFSGNTQLISLQPVGAAVRVAFGSNPTATATSKYIADGDIYDVEVIAGDIVAVIDA